MRGCVSEAAGNQLNHQEFLELIVNDELAVRDDRAIARRIKKAGFREIKSLEEFDFSFNPSIKRRQIMDLATGRFIRERTDLLMLGPPGVGKSHLVQGIGHQAARIGFTVLYRSIFDTIAELTQAENFRNQSCNYSFYTPNFSSLNCNIPILRVF